jgi:hypothetical protein
VARSLIDIVTLDLRIEEEISKYGTLKDFHIVLWRQDPDKSKRRPTVTSLSA